jgi:hypothetical protein
MEDPITPLVLALWPAASALLLLVGARASRLRLDLPRAVLSCLAGSSVGYLLFRVAQFRLEAAATRFSAVAAAPEIFAAALVTVQALVLAACLRLVCELPLVSSGRLAALAAGGTLAAAALLAIHTGQGGVEPRSAMGSAWILLFAGVALLTVAYLGLAGRSRVGAAPLWFEPAAGPRARRAAAGALRPPMMPFGLPAAHVATGGRAPDSQPTVPFARRGPVNPTGWLVVAAGVEKGRSFELSEGDFRLGRGSNCAIRIPGDLEISRAHSLIRVSGKRCELHDLASRNATFLNGTRVGRPRLLLDGDEVQLGQSRLRFRKPG